MLFTGPSQPNYQNVLPEGQSRENVTILSPQTNLQFDKSEIDSVLSDFEKLDFEDNKCFDEIASSYRKKEKISLFDYVILNKRKEIIDILDRKRAPSDQEVFRRRFGRYLLRVSEGMDDGKRLLGSDSSIAFFDGCYVTCKYTGRLLNHHDLLNINITKPGQTLETSRLFTKKTKRMEEEKSEVKRAKMYDNGKRIITIEKNEKQQRNYSFTKEAICKFEVSWNAKDESEKNLNCVVVLNVNSGQISIGKSTINGKDVELKDILELAKQNEVVLIGGKALHEVLEERLIQRAPCEKEKSIQSHENIIVPSSALNEEIAVERGFSPQKEVTTTH